MKKGKKMPSIELDGHSEAQFKLVEGKIVRVAAPTPLAGTSPGPSFDVEPSFRD